MNKDKEWLKEEVQKRIDKLPRTYSGLYIEGSRDAYHLALQAINQLDEPEKVVIPQFVATFIEDSRNKVGCIVTAIWEMYEYEYRDVYDWTLEDGNDEVLMMAFANGYEIEKEKLYQVIIPTKDAVWEYYYLDHDGGIGVENNLKYVASHTEEFIRSISDDLWHFAVEVAGK